MGKLLYLVIHCTATVAGREVTKDELFRWHMGLKDNKDGTYNYKGHKYKNLKEVPQEDFHGKFSLKTQGRGWGQVGYADLVHLDGKIENLVPYDEDNIVEAWEVTNGAFTMNGTSRHITFAGGLVKLGKPGDTRTDAQKAALESYVKGVIGLHPEIKVMGHYQCPNNATGCPNFDVPAWLTEIGVAEANIVK